MTLKSEFHEILFLMTAYLATKGTTDAKETKDLIGLVVKEELEAKRRKII